MKKIFLCAFALGCFAVSNAQDFRTDELEQQQLADTTTTIVEPAEKQPENTYSELDSHQQAVNVLQSQLDYRNRKDKLRSVWEKRSTFFNIGYVEEKLNNQEQPEWTEMKSKYGAFISIGHTYYIPRNPIFGIIRFGIDATWFDVSYAYFDSKEQNNIQNVGMKGALTYLVSSGEKIDLTKYYPNEGKLYEPMAFGHHLAIGMGLGPSLTINPVDALKIAGYFHVVPTYNGMMVKTKKIDYVYSDRKEYTRYSQNEFFHGFTLMTKFGGSISYKTISLGIESRTGSGKMTYEEGNPHVVGENNKFDPTLYEKDKDYRGEKIKNKFKVTSTRFFIAFRF